MPDENLSPQSQEESTGGEEENESEMRRNLNVSRGECSPHSTTTTGTTPPSRKSNQTSKEVEDEEDRRRAAAGESTDCNVDSNRAGVITMPLKQVLAAVIKLSATISRQHSDSALQIVADLLIGAIDSNEFHYRVAGLVHLAFRSFVLPLLDRQLNGLREELAGTLHPVRHLAQQSTVSQTTKEHVKVLLSLDSQLQSHHENSTSESSSPQQLLSVWQVFQPGVASLAGTQGRSHTAGSEPAAPAESVMEVTQLQQQQNATTRKRRASASLVENSGGGGDRAEETRKRESLYSTHPPAWIPPKGNSIQHPQHSTSASLASGGPREREMLRIKSSYPTTLMASFQPQQGDEEWANIHTMLNCILSMVEKTRRALGILQQRASNDNQLQQQKRRDSSYSSSIHHQQQVTYEASELRRQAGELIAQTLKATEDRVNQVKRKAEEAVHDVRRAAMAELQRALSAERLRADRLASEARRQGAEEALSALGQHTMMGSGNQPHYQTSLANKELCWNCGRRANETCSGCNVARYCSTFCQHKHWEVHHKICGRVSQVTLAAAAPSSASSTDHQSESGSPSSSSQQRSSHHNHSKTPSPVQQQTSASYVH